MQLISFIASTMLIVLISQHSIMGLPIDNTTMEVPVESMTASNEIETSSFATEGMVIQEEKPVPKKPILPKSGSCPEGMEHGKHGICQEITSYETTEAMVELTTEFNKDMVIQEEKPVPKKPILPKSGSCPEGMEHGKHGICQEITSYETTEAMVELTTEFNKDMVIQEEKPVPKKPILPKSGSCAEGWEHGKHGICQEITSYETTEAMVELTTEFNKELGDETTEVMTELTTEFNKELGDETTEVMTELTTELNEKSGGVENVNGCPEGTKYDEEGACQPIKPSKLTKKVSNPKTLLQKDGSCPENYKMIEGRCLYVKSKANSTLFSNGVPSGQVLPRTAQPKSGIDESSKPELVPVLSDNSCPEGTEYSQYGLCQKRTRLSNSKLRIKSDGSCPDDFELVKGKCTYKSSKIEGQSILKRTSTKPMFTTTLPAEPVSHEETHKSDNVGEPDV